MASYIDWGCLAVELWKEQAKALFKISSLVLLTQQFTNTCGVGSSWLHAVRSDGLSPHNRQGVLPAKLLVFPPSSLLLLRLFASSPLSCILYTSALASSPASDLQTSTYAFTLLTRAVMPMQWLTARLRASKTGKASTASWMLIVLLYGLVSLGSAMKESRIAELRKEAHDMFRYRQLHLGVSGVSRVATETDWC